MLRRRTSRLVLVLERPWNDENVQAVMRTAEAFGVQHFWTVKHPYGRHRVSKTVTKGTHRWLTRRQFPDTESCIAALREENLEIWSTDLDPGAKEILTPRDLLPLPERFALVIGREVDGVSDELLEASHRRLYLPMRGFGESYNLSVATALFVQRCFDADPELEGAMPDEERQALRRDWYERLAGGSEEREAEFAAWAENPPEPLEDVRPTEESRKPRVPKKLRAQVWPGGKMPE